jgi:hypothetical protein
MRGHLNACELCSAIKHGVNRELKMFGFPACDARTQIVEAASAESLSELTTSSSESDVRRVTRRVVRKLVEEGKHRDDVVVDDADENDERGLCSIGNGVFVGSSLNRAHHVSRLHVEDELIEYIDRKRRLTRFIESVGIETWRWFVRYWRAGRKSDSGRERVRFHRLKRRLENLLEGV